MTEKPITYVGRRRIEPYWYVIGLFGLAVAALFIYHLTTGQTPNRVAIHIELFNFNIFWYGILIVGGIMLGAWVVAHLAAERAWIVFDETVPATVQEMPLTELALPEEIEAALNKRAVTSLSGLLFEWGLDPARLSLNKTGREVVEDRLAKVPEVQASWIDDAPWRLWNPDNVWSGLAWVVVFGVIGARLYHVLTPSPSMAAVGIYSAFDYFRKPMELINIRSGGLGIYGAIFGGLLGILFYTRRQHISAIAWADLAVIGLALGQFVGRWGNFFNQELYGAPTALPWGIFIQFEHRIRPFDDLGAYPLTTRFHPAFLYESLWNLLTFLVLLTLEKRYRDRLQTGDLLATYLIFYAVGRILLELVRLDSRTVSLAGLDLGLPVATLVSIIVAVPMAILLIYRHLLAKD